MKYPKSKKSAQKYAAHLSELHRKTFAPIERVVKIKNTHAINFAAAENGDELKEYLTNGWKLVS